MDLKLESREDYLLATAVGRVSLKDALELDKSVFDAAAERGFDKILLDCLAVEGELSILARYELGTPLAEYCKSRSMTPKVAVIGKMPTITGFGAFAANRGLPVKTFPGLQPALDWLNAFGTKANAS